MKAPSLPTTIRSPRPMWLATAVLLALCAVGATPGHAGSAGAPAAERLRALLDTWYVELMANSDPSVWGSGAAKARRIADETAFEDALLEAEKDHLSELADELLGATGDRDALINQNGAYNLLWQALEDAIALRLEKRREQLDEPIDLRSRLDVWRDQIAAEAGTDEDRWHAAEAALAEELADGPATDDALALELEVSQRRVRRLHAGPVRYYLGPEALYAMLAEIDGLEQAVALRAKQAGTAARPRKDPP